MAGNGGVVSTASAKNQSNANGYQDAGDERIEATKIIRESNTEIPIIMQTAYAFSSDKENAMNAGATEVLVKPITLVFSALR